jgi:hypothetical protein
MASPGKRDKGLGTGAKKNSRYLLRGEKTVHPIPPGLKSMRKEMLCGAKRKPCSMHRWVRIGYSVIFAATDARSGKGKEVFAV